MSLSRRSFLGALAGVPVIGAIIKPVKAHHVTQSLADDGGLMTINEARSISKPQAKPVRGGIITINGKRTLVREWNVDIKETPFDLTKRSIFLPKQISASGTASIRVPTYRPDRIHEYLFKNMGAVADFVLVAANRPGVIVCDSMAA